MSKTVEIKKTTSGDFRLIITEKVPYNINGRKGVRTSESNVPMTSYDLDLLAEAVNKYKNENRT